MTNTKIKFSFMVIIALMIGLLAFGFSSTEMVFADGGEVDLPFQNEGDVYSPSNPDEVKDGKALSTLVNTMYTFAKYISWLIFGVSVIMIVWAGFKYATSQGDTRVMEQAKMQIITSGIGIGVALFAMVIVGLFGEIYGI